MDYIKGIKVTIGVLVLLLLSTMVFSWLPGQIEKLAGEQGGWLQSVVGFFKGEKEDPTDALHQTSSAPAVPVAPQTPGGNRSSSVQDDAPWLSEGYDN